MTNPPATEVSDRSPLCGLARVRSVATIVALAFGLLYPPAAPAAEAGAADAAAAAEAQAPPPAGQAQKGTQDQRNAPAGENSANSDGSKKPKAKNGTAGDNGNDKKKKDSGEKSGAKDGNDPNADKDDAASGKPAEPSLIPGLDEFHKEQQRWKDAGVDFSLDERSEVWADVAGGGRRGLSYIGLTTAQLNVDLDKLAHWANAEFLVSAFDVHGHGPTRSRVGNLQIVSNIEATPTPKLYDLWLDQALFDKKLSIRLGQEGANDEFMISSYAATLFNSSFGFPGVPAAVLPSGGPNYPLATPFARAKLKLDDHWRLIGGVYNGDPAPAGPGDPQIRDRNGLAFRLNDHALAVGEIWYAPQSKFSDALRTTYKLGVWYATNHFADQRFDKVGVRLADPASSGMPRQLTGDYAVYGIIDQILWKKPDTEDKGIGAFFLAMGGPSDRNLSNFYIEGGINWRAPFEKRDDDIFGLGVAYLGISPAARAFSRDLIAFGRGKVPYASNETVVEATYKAKVSEALTLQPDLQWVINPGAAIPGAFGGRVPLPDALVIGIRVMLKL